MCNTMNKNYSVHATSTTTHLNTLNDTLPIVSVKLHTTTELPPAGKEYFCFKINSKSSHDSQCAKSRIMNMAIDYIPLIHKFEQQCVVIKEMLQSPLIEYHIKTIGIEQSLSNRPSVEQKCLNKTERYINMLVSVITNKNSRIFLILIWFLLHSKSLV